MGHEKFTFVVGLLSCCVSEDIGIGKLPRCEKEQQKHYTVHCLNLATRSRLLS